MAGDGNNASVLILIILVMLSRDSIIEGALMVKSMVTAKWTQMYLFFICWNILYKVN